MNFTLTHWQTPSASRVVGLGLGSGLLSHSHSQPHSCSVVLPSDQIQTLCRKCNSVICGLVIMGSLWRQFIIELSAFAEGGFGVS